MLSHQDFLYYAGFRKKTQKNPTCLLVSTEITLGQMFPKKYPVRVPDGRGCVLELTDSPEHTCVQQICLIFTDMLTLNSVSVQVWQHVRG